MSEQSHLLPPNRPADIETNGDPGFERLEPNDKYKDIASYFFPLGWVSFGGPQAHVALAHRRLVDEAKWIDEQLFIELFALANALPGPSSTQLMSAIGAVKGGLLGGLLAFTLFQLPGFLAMMLFGYIVRTSDSDTDNSLAAVILQLFTRISAGLIAAAFAQVALASYTISTKACENDTTRWGLNLASTIIASLISPEVSSWVFPLMMVVGGITTLAKAIQRRNNAGTTGNASASAAGLTTEEHNKTDDELMEHSIRQNMGIALLIIFVVVTLLVVGLKSSSLFGVDQLYYQLFDVFWRIGCAIFGGGQVVLPMIYNEVVARGWLSEDVFLYGFALVQCMPGPMFNLGTFVGTVMLGVPGALLASLGLFGPGIILIFGLLPFWTRFRQSRDVKAFLSGVNSVAAGLINAALYLFLQKSLPNAAAYSISVLAGVLTVVYKFPAPLTILIGGFIGYCLRSLGIGGPY